MDGGRRATGEGEWDGSKTDFLRKRARLRLNRELAARAVPARRTATPWVPNPARHVEADLLARST